MRFRFEQRDKMVDLAGFIQFSAFGGTQHSAAVGAEQIT